MPKINRLTKRLLMIYSQGQIAKPSDRFQVWGTDIDRVEFIPEGEGSTLAESFEVVGEVGSDWAEMVEVAFWMNEERDGNIYFVGDGAGRILKPSWREMRWTASFHAKNPCSMWTTEELMAWALMVGGDWYNLLTY